MTTFDGDNVKADDIEGERVRSESVQTDKLSGGFFGGAEVASHPAWDEDANSPFSVSGDSSYTQTLSDTFDVWTLVIGDFSPASNATKRIQMQVEGDTGTNYSYVGYDGSVTTGASQWRIGELTPDKTSRVTALTVTGRWGSNTDCGMHTAYLSEAAGAANQGRNNNVSSPLSKFTVKSQAGTNFDATIEAYGRDI